MIQLNVISVVSDLRINKSQTLWQLLYIILIGSDICGGIASFSLMTSFHLWCMILMSLITPFVKY